MKTWINRNWDNLIYFYLMITMVFWSMRMMVNFDCTHRYMDYLFPLTKLHCEIN